ncbi:MAG: hypothetical protein WHT09_16065 [Thermogutta sp.]|jgi:hypothetical protein
MNREGELQGNDHRLKERCCGCRRTTGPSAVGRVELPHALARKYPNADRQWCRQYVFPQEHR